MKYRMAVILPTYAAMFAGCYFAAYLLRFDFVLRPEVWALYVSTVTTLVGIKLATCMLTGEWQRSYRYAVFSDMFYVVGSAAGGAVLLFCANAAGLFGPVPRSVILIDLVLTIPASGIIRVAARVYTEFIRVGIQRAAQKDCQRVLVVGTDREAVDILRAIQANDCHYEVVGLAGNHVGRSRMLIAGVPIYPLSKGWERLTTKLSVDVVLIPGSVPGKRVREIVEESRRSGFRVRVIPSVNELVDGRFKLAVRDVTITDLLRREPARLDAKRIRETIENRCVLVTGAAGSIGSELCRQILQMNPAKLVLLDQSELGMFQMTQEFANHDGTTDVAFVVGDVTDAKRLKQHFAEHAPETVFHAAAYKHVPLMEANVREAVRNNVFGTKTVVDCAVQAGVGRFILISTDKAVHPSSVMGATKLLAEKYTQVVAAQSSMCCITVRFGNVLNSAGSVVPTFRKQIERGGPITVTHPQMERFFMTIPEAVQLVLQAGAVGSSGDLLVLEMGKPCKIVDLAKDMIALSGLRYPDDVDIIFTGLRPGEKLTEELFYSGEECSNKVHEKIFCANRKTPSAVFVSRMLERLQHGLSLTGDEAADLLWKSIRSLVNETAEPAAVLRRAA